jgi:hypothetical protein
LGGPGGLRCKAGGGVIASYGDDEQRSSAPARADPNVAVIFERLLRADRRFFAHSALFPRESNRPFYALCNKIRVSAYKNESTMNNHE